MKTFFIRSAMFFAVFLLIGQGCVAGTDTGSNGSDGAMMEDVPAFEAPSDWGTLRTETFNVNYPPEYTSDLDFETLENVISVRETGEELIRISVNDDGEPEFRQIADEVEYFDEIVGSTELK